jgi:hypothetical protein
MAVFIFAPKSINILLAKGASMLIPEQEIN